jgi:hypothetical protein
MKYAAEWDAQMIYIKNKAWPMMAEEYVDGCL